MPRYRHEDFIFAFVVQPGDLSWQAELLLESAILQTRSHGIKIRLVAMIPRHDMITHAFRRKLVEAGVEILEFEARMTRGKSRFGIKYYGLRELMARKEAVRYTIIDTDVLFLDYPTFVGPQIEAPVITIRSNGKKVRGHHNQFWDHAYECAELPRPENVWTRCAQVHPFIHGCYLSVHSSQKELVDEWARIFPKLHKRLTGRMRNHLDEVAMSISIMKVVGTRFLFSDEGRYWPMIEKDMRGKKVTKTLSAIAHYSHRRHEKMRTDLRIIRNQTK
jgi:hypothetical protein